MYGGVGSANVCHGVSNLDQMQQPVARCVKVALLHVWQNVLLAVHAHVSAVCKAA